MTDAPAATPSPAAQRRRARYRWSYIVAIGGGVLGGILAKIGEQPGQDTANIAGLAAMLVAMVAGMWLYHVAIDEHEKDVVLWANSAGLYTLISLLLASLMLRRLSDPVMLSIQTCLALTAVVGLIVFVWRKYF